MKKKSHVKKPPLKCIIWISGGDSAYKSWVTLAVAPLQDLRAWSCLPSLKIRRGNLLHSPFQMWSSQSIEYSKIILFHISSFIIELNMFFNKTFFLLIMWLHFHNRLVRLEGLMLCIFELNLFFMLRTNSFVCTSRQLFKIQKIQTHTILIELIYSCIVR